MHERAMERISTSDFEVNLAERRVVHKPSGMWFSFYEYTNEDDWRRSDSVIFRDNPEWPGNRGALAAAAKRAAIDSGMKAQKPAA
jgi:hypothetical protein